jgi:hypothetical protein
MAVSQRLINHLPAYRAHARRISAIVAPSRPDPHRHCQRRERSCNDHRSLRRCRRGRSRRSNRSTSCSEAPGLSSCGSSFYAAFASEGAPEFRPFPSACWGLNLPTSRSLIGRTRFAGRRVLYMAVLITRYCAVATISVIPVASPLLVAQAPLGEPKIGGAVK